MNILFCAPLSGRVGGIKSWAGNIVNYYDKDPDIKLFPLDMGREENLNFNSSLIKRAFLGARAYADHFTIFKRACRKNKIDLVHLSTSGSISFVKDILILRWAKKRQIETLLHFHFGRISQLLEKKNWESFLLRKTLKYVDKIVVLDSKAFSALKNKGFKNVYYLPNPVSDKTLAICEQNKINNRKNRSVLFVGNVIRSKGVFELIAACRKLDNLSISIVGKAEVTIQEELKQMLQGTCNDITFKGVLRHEETIQEMLKAEILVLPSHTEGFPNVILEAMAAKCFVIASDVGEIPIMINQYGTIVTTKNIELLANAIGKSLSDSKFRLDMTEKAFVRLKNEYSIDNVAKQLNKIWFEKNGNY